MIERRFRTSDIAIFGELYFRPSGMQFLRLQTYDRLDAVNEVEKKYIDTAVQAIVSGLYDLQVTKTPLEYKAAPT